MADPQVLKITNEFTWLMAKGLLKIIFLLLPFALIIGLIIKYTEKKLERKIDNYHRKRRNRR
jgi:hypothetical protein